MSIMIRLPIASKATTATITTPVWLFSTGLKYLFYLKFIFSIIIILNQSINHNRYCYALQWNAYTMHLPDYKSCMMNNFAANYYFIIILFVAWIRLCQINVQISIIGMASKNESMVISLVPDVCWFHFHIFVMV